MVDTRESQNKRRITWVTGNPLSLTLDAATWIETTRVLREEGWEVTLLSEGAGGRETVQGLEVHTLHRANIYFLGRVLFHLYMIRYLFQSRKRIDILLFHQISAPWIFLLRMLSSLLGLYFPLLVMDTRDLNDYEGGLKNWFRVSYFKFAHFLANKWADGQTAITPKMAELTHIPESKLLGIWPSGVDLDRFAPAQEGRKWPQGDEPVRLIYTGKLHAERKLLPLCQAVVKANQHGMSFIFILLGDGLERAVLESFAQETEGSIVVERPVPHEVVPDFLRRIHIGVTPLPALNDPKFESSSPIKMFEYMAAGMPILATRNICHTSVVRDKNYAFWADDGELDDLYPTLEGIWEDRGNLMEMGLLAAVEAKNWTWEASGIHLSNALEQCLLDANLDNVSLDSKKADTQS